MAKFASSSYFQLNPNLQSRTTNSATNLPNVNDSTKEAIIESKKYTIFHPVEFAVPFPLIILDTVTFFSGDIKIVYFIQSK